MSDVACCRAVLAAASWRYSHSYRHVDSSEESPKPPLRLETAAWRDSAARRDRATRKSLIAERHLPWWASSTWVGAVCKENAWPARGRCSMMPRIPHLASLPVQPHRPRCFLRPLPPPAPPPPAECPVTAPRAHPSPAHARRQGRRHAHALGDEVAHGRGVGTGGEDEGWGRRHE